MSLKMCRLLLVIGAMHGLIDKTGRQAALTSWYAPINLMRLLTYYTVAAKRRLKVKVPCLSSGVFSYWTDTAGK